MVCCITEYLISISTLILAEPDPTRRRHGTRPFLQVGSGSPRLFLSQDHSSKYFILISISFSLRIIALLVLVLDIVLVIVELSVGEDCLPVKVEEVFEVLTLLFSAYFCGEVALRIVGQG